MNIKLDRFPANLGFLSNDQGQRFHRCICKMEIGTKERGCRHAR